ncbi:MAG: DUF3596 domain-containing protein, partial [Kovacikia sp.]
MATTPKAKKGTVSVTVDKARLRLGWRYQEKRQFLYTGLPDTPTNRRVAERKATQIELDIKSGHFDPSLKAYKTPQKILKTHSVVELFEQFMQFHYPSPCSVIRNVMNNPFALIFRR